MKRAVLVLGLTLAVIFFLNRHIQLLWALHPAVHTTLINADKRDYKIGVCKNTGTVYEFFNNRSDPATNTVQDFYGSAVQIAIHSGERYSLITQPCGISEGQGYFNPTQAGASCSWPNNKGHTTPKAGQDVSVFCDGLLNNNCSTATNQIFHTSHRMMNWDYGPGYEGPYNIQDAFFLEQDLNLRETYAQFDISVINKGIDRSTAFEIPTYYFIDTYRKYYYQEGSIIKEATLPPSTPEIKLPINANFITVENPNKSNSAITVAWFYSKEFREDILQEFTSVLSAPFEGKDYVKLTNAPRVNVKKDKEYRLRYLLIPYKYNEEIETEYGRITVLDLINRENNVPSSASIALNGSEYGLADKYISLGSAAGNFLVNADNQLLIGLKGGQTYSNNQALGYAYIDSRHLPLGKKIKRIDFEYETNFDNNKFFAAVDIPGAQFYWKEERFGVNSGKITLSFPEVSWVAFGLYSKQGFTYPFPDWEWHLLIKNLKLYYEEGLPTQQGRWRLVKEKAGDGTSFEVLIKNVGAGEFDSNKMAVWHHDKNNPQLTAKPGGDSNIYAPDLVQNGGAWNLYYGGWDGTTDRHDRISIGASYHGLSQTEWTERSTIIDHGEYLHINDPSIVRISGNEWYLAYTAAKPVGSCYRDWISISTSKDGVSWQPFSPSTSNEIVLHNAPADLQDVARPSLLKDGEEWKLYFDRGGVDSPGCPPNYATIYLATSSDLKNFYYQGQVSYGNDFATEPDVEKFADTYLMVTGWFENGIYWSASKDGRNFIPHQKLFGKSGEDYDRLYTTNPAIVRQGNRLLGIWYGAHTERLEDAKIAAAYLQKEMLFETGGSSTKNALALGPEDLVIKLPGSEATGVLKIYDTDWLTFLFQSEPVTLRGGDVYRLEPVGGPLQGDLNNDGRVNTQDIKILLSRYGTNNPEADLNADGVVNGVDFGRILRLIQ